MNFTKFTAQELLAANSYGEARLVEDSLLDDIKEWLAIGSTVMNRVYSPRWGNNVKEVILQPKQFSWTNDGDPSKEAVWKFLTTRSPGGMYKILMLYADVVLSGRTVDFSNGANHYVAEWFYRKAPDSHWCRSMTITALYGGHIFLSDGRP